MYNTDTHAAYIDCIYICLCSCAYIYICAFCFLTHPANKNKQHKLRNWIWQPSRSVPACGCKSLLINFFFLSKNDVYHFYKYTSKYHVHHDQMHYFFGCRPGKPMSNLSRVRWDIPCRWMDNRYAHQIFCVTKSIEHIKKNKLSRTFCSWKSLCYPLVIKHHYEQIRFLIGRSKYM